MTMTQKNSSFSKILQKHPMIVFLSTFFFNFSYPFGESRFLRRSDIILCFCPECVTDFPERYVDIKTAETGQRSHRYPQLFSSMDDSVQLCATSSR